MIAPGLHFDLQAAEYHADQLADRPTLSRGCAKTLIARSPAHAWLGHPRFGAKSVETSKVMDRGSVIHELLLGSGSGIAVAPFDSWRTNESKAFRDAAVASGKTPILKEAYDDALAAASGIRDQIAQRGLGEVLIAAKHEVTALFEDDGVLCRVRFDALEIEDGLHRACVLDPKITDDASLESCERKIGSMYYALQFAFYVRALEVLRPDLRNVEFIFLFCEPEPPFAVRPIRLSGAWKEIGKAQYRRALELWKRCLSTNHWPAYEGEIEYVEPRAWDMRELEI